jgi:uncharacterized membrane protein YtjA (UPF0391 family)
MIGEVMLLDWAIIFLVLALIAGILGFGGIAKESAGIAKILFVVFLVIYLISFLSQHHHHDFFRRMFNDDKEHH